VENFRAAHPCGATIGREVLAVQLAATVVGFTKRPDHAAITLQSEVQVLDV
jgi:hypothetical protein